MMIKDAIANIAKKRGVSSADAEYLFNERVGIKTDHAHGSPELDRAAMKQAYDELMKGDQ